MRYRYCVLLLIAAAGISCQQSDSAPTSPSPATQKSTPAVITATSATTTSQPSPYFRAPELAAMRTLPRENDPLPMEQLAPSRNVYDRLLRPKITAEDFANFNDLDYITAARALTLGAGPVFKTPDDLKNLIRPDDSLPLAKAISMVAWRYATRYSEKSQPRPDDLPIIRQLYTMAKDGSWQKDPSMAVEIAFWMAKAMLDIPDDDRYWKSLRDGLSQLQNADGGWGRDANISDMAMTAAALWTLQTCRWKLDKSVYDSTLKNANYSVMEKGFAWLDAAFPVFADETNISTATRAESMYYIMEMANASQLYRIGGVNWFEVGRKMIADKTYPGRDAGFFEAICHWYFLDPAESRFPVGHLKYDGGWNNRPLALNRRWHYNRPVAIASWFTARIVDIQSPVDLWPEVPVLVITGNNAVSLSSIQMARLKLFVERGGTIFACAEKESAQFLKSMSDIFSKIWPDFKLEPLDKDQRPWQIMKSMGTPPKMQQLSNGIRPIAYLCESDLTLKHQLDGDKIKCRESDTIQDILEIGGFTPWHPLILWPTEKNFTPVATIKAARLKYDGFIDRQPQAWERFRLKLAGDCKIQADIVGPVEIADLTASGAKIAILEGVGNISLTDDQRSALKKFVAGGGTLLVDSLGGDETFADAARLELKKIWGIVGPMKQIQSNCPMLNIPDYSIRKVAYRSEQQSRLERQTNEPLLRTIDADDRQAVFFSREDIAAGLLDCRATTIYGYTPEIAYELARNIFIYAGQIKLPPTKPLRVE